MSSRIRLFVLTALATLTLAAPAFAQLKVVATTEDLASIARDIGGDRVTVTGLAKGYQDPHNVDPKPSFILQVSRADVLIVVGRELEIGWLPPLITQSRNRKIQPGSPGYLDASRNVRILELPSGEITRAMGDVHPLGNPHYWLDPENGRRIAASIRDKFSELAPNDRAGFAQRYTAFDQRLAAAEKRWDAAMAPFKGTKIVTYHRSWPNFMSRFGLNVAGYVEPKPGISPSPSHTLGLIEEMKRQKIRLIVMESYFDPKTPQAIASQAGARVVTLAPSVGGEKNVTDYIALFDHNIGLLSAALRQAAGK
jgi:zinc/manganese transport system substrate-binding protein